MAWMVLPRPISSAINARPARAANNAPCFWYGYNGTRSSFAIAASVSPRMLTEVEAAIAWLRQRYARVACAGLSIGGRLSLMSSADCMAAMSPAVVVAEVSPQGNKVLIGPPWLTRFEKARITGSRALQLSLGAPPLIKVPELATSSIALAVMEIDNKALPISIRRILPNGMYQDIPIEWMK